uniref:Uncharacterized protein n=1 Tax=Picea glauca TaxID=3330 RepID=A0A101M0L3_PICGL|nr:hypothetical protein ABT39_MTgene4157 [Picea glauca]
MRCYLLFSLLYIQATWPFPSHSLYPKLDHWKPLPLLDWPVLFQTG